LIAYSQVLHLDAPAKRTVEAIDKFVSSPGDHEGKEWWGYRLKYRLQGEADEPTEGREASKNRGRGGWNETREDRQAREGQEAREDRGTREGQETAEGEDIAMPDLVSLYTPGDNDLISRGVDKFLYPFFLVCFVF